MKPGNSILHKELRGRAGGRSKGGSFGDISYVSYIALYHKLNGVASDLDPRYTTRLDVSGGSVATTAPADCSFAGWQVLFTCGISRF